MVGGLPFCHDHGNSSVVPAVHRVSSAVPQKTVKAVQKCEYVNIAEIIADPAASTDEEEDKVLGLTEG